MLQNSRISIILFGLMAISFNLKGTRTDPLKYGMRIQPVNVLSEPKSRSDCTACYNKTSDNKKEIARKIPYDNLKANVRREDKSSVNYITESRAIHKNSHFTVKPLIKTQQTAQPIFSARPKENFNNRGATFFFTQVEPHRFEYRAMFQHHNDAFNPFTNFEPFSKDFPPLPNFPDFPNFPELHHDHKNPFPNFPEFNFPTLPPAIKRVWQQPPADVQPKGPSLHENFENPLLKNYNLILDTGPQYPKIFRFNEERINIEEFDRQKKLRYYNVDNSGQNDLSEPENVKRGQLLILHGGIFTVQEPPLYNKHVKRIRKRIGYGRHSS